MRVLNEQASIILQYLAWLSFRMREGEGNEFYLVQGERTGRHPLHFNKYLSLDRRDCLDFDDSQWGPQCYTGDCSMRAGGGHACNFGFGLLPMKSTQTKL